jgi:hypothetical protein
MEGSIMKAWKIPVLLLVLGTTFVCVTESPAGSRCRRGPAPSYFYPAVPIMPGAEETVDLRWKFEANKPFYLQVDTKTDQSMKVAGTDVLQKQVQTFYLRVTPERKEQGNWVLSMKFVGIRLNLDIGGNKIEFDTTVQSPQSTLVPTLKAMHGMEFKVILTPEMTISRAEGLEEFIRGHSKENPQWEPTLRSILSENAIKKMFEHIFPPIPQPLRKGKTWTRDASFIDNIGTFKSTTKYTYEGNKATLERIKVEPKGSYTLPRNLAGALRTKMTLPGEILFDRVRGRIVHASIPLKLEGTLNIDIGGIMNKVDLRQLQTIKVELTEKNPLPAK